MADQGSSQEREPEFPHVAVSGMAALSRHTPLRPFVVVWPGTTPAHQRDATALPHHRRFGQGSRPLPEALLLGPHSQSSEYQRC